MTVRKSFHFCHCYAGLVLDTARQFRQVGSAYTQSESIVVDVGLILRITQRLIIEDYCSDTVGMSGSLGETLPRLSQKLQSHICPYRLYSYPVAALIRASSLQQAQPRPQYFSRYPV